MSEGERIYAGGFRDVWRRINGGWDPDEVVVVYEFKVVDPPLSRARIDRTDSLKIEAKR